MTTKLRFASIYAVAILVAVGIWSRAEPAASVEGFTVQAQHDRADTASAPKAGDTTSSPKAGQQTMMRGEMMARMKARDDRLQALVTAMNQATGDTKIAAMATLLAALAGERMAMGDGMTQMQAQMMDMRKSMQEGMVACPMMQQAPGKH